MDQVEAAGAVCNARLVWFIQKLSIGNCISYSLLLEDAKAGEY
jgi:hypothetical protein